MWYYAENGVQNGPLTETDFNALVANGKVTADSLVWREGMAAWQAWREVRPAAAPVTAPAAPPVFAQNNFSQPHAAGSATEEQIRARDYEHDFGTYFNQAWELVKSDFGGFILATLVVGLCIGVVNGIPYLSVITGIVFTGPLMGGLMLFFLKKLRRESAQLGDAFGGFGSRFGQLIAANVVPGLLAMLALIPAGIVVGVAAIGGAFVHVHESLRGLPIWLLAGGGLLGVAGLCVMVYLQTCWIFTVWLVADKHLNFWQAMNLSRAVVNKHWWQTFFLGMIAGLITLAGLLCCCVGALVSAPVALAFQAQAYEKLFGDLIPEA